MIQICRFFENPAIEFQPGELAIEETILISLAYGRRFDPGFDCFG